MKKLMLYGAVTVVALGIVGALVGPQEGKNTTAPAAKEQARPNAAPDPRACLVLAQDDAIVEGGFTKIKGTVTNKCGQSYRYVQVSYTLHDDDDAKLGDALANTAGLEDGQVWRFEAVGLREAARYKLTAVTAY